ncbi:MAG: ATP-binding protein [Anaerolineales bacterium]|nr:ATP-binding protein [Anaerolineales bacterium]
MKQSLKQLVILSGKGGTGKTSVTAALAHLAFTGSPPVKVVLADADVDAANLGLVLQPDQKEEHDFVGGALAVIDQNKCEGCGICEQVCRFYAVIEDGKKYTVDSRACDGCAACVYQCPDEAITMQPQVVGRWFRADSRYGPLLHAELEPAQENSGKLVTMVKQQARLWGLDNALDVILIDGPPGIGCPAISAASGADLALIVAEPTVSGIHDLKRILQMTMHFRLRSLVCINKADVFPEGTIEIEHTCQILGVDVIGKIPFDETVTQAMVHGEAVTAYCLQSPASQAICAIWQKLRSLLLEEE